MKKKILVASAVLLILISGGIYMYNKATKPNFGPKTTKLYQRGFRLLEEQIGLYIKEHYSGVSKIEFSPIYVTGDDGFSMLVAEMVPIVYDQHGNAGRFGGKFKNFRHPAYGTNGALYVGVNDSGEYIELGTDSGELSEVRDSQSLPKEFKREKIDDVDLNIQNLIAEGKLKGVEKSDVGSPDAEIIYNLELKKGVHLDDAE